MNAMDTLDFSSRSNASHRQARAEDVLAELFENARWRVFRQPAGRHGYRPDLVVRRRGASYVVEVKTGGSSLSARERRVRDAILSRKVGWQGLRTSS